MDIPHLIGSSAQSWFSDLVVRREEAEMTRARIYVALAVLTAFLTGSVFAGYIGPRLSNTPATLTEQPRVVAQEPATRYVAERRSPAVKRHRSWEREALIVGGGAGAGAAIGAVAKGRKGAAVGALTGGIAGLIYDLATRNR